MMNKQACLNKYSGLNTGMDVYSRDGEKLGKIVDLGDDYFTVEKGIFFPKDFTARYDDITDLHDDNLYLNMTKDEAFAWRDQSYQGWNQTEDINTGRLSARPSDDFHARRGYEWAGATAGAATTTQKIPIAEEQLEAQKTMRQKGEVRLRKVVHTEFRHFTVPVTREEVRVERVPVTDQTAATTTAEFKDETVSVPVMEEEVTVSKRPVVKEEVRISKEQYQEQKDISGEVRKEDVKIEGDQVGKKKIA